MMFNSLYQDDSNGSIKDVGLILVTSLGLLVFPLCTVFSVENFLNSYSRDAKHFAYFFVVGFILLEAGFFISCWILVFGIPIEYCIMGAYALMVYAIIIQSYVIVLPLVDNRFYDKHTVNILYYTFFTCHITVPLSILVNDSIVIIAFKLSIRR